MFPHPEQAQPLNSEPWQGRSGVGSQGSKMLMQETSYQLGTQTDFEQQRASMQAGAEVSPLPLVGTRGGWVLSSTPVTPQLAGTC